MAAISLTIMILNYLLFLASAYQATATNDQLLCYNRCYGANITVSNDAITAFCSEYAGKQLGPGFDQFESTYHYAPQPGTGDQGKIWVHVTVLGNCHDYVFTLDENDCLQKLQVPLTECDKDSPEKRGGDVLHDGYVAYAIQPSYNPC